MSKTIKISKAVRDEAAALAVELACKSPTVVESLQALIDARNPGLQRNVCRVLQLRLAEAMVTVDRLREFMFRHDLFAITLDEIHGEKVRRGLLPADGQVAEKAEAVR